MYFNKSEWYGREKDLFYAPINQLVYSDNCIPLKAGYENKYAAKPPSSAVSQTTKPMQQASQPILKEESKGNSSQEHTENNSKPQPSADIGTIIKSLTEEQREFLETLHSKLTSSNQYS